jgi:hypothetical protein
VLATTRRALLTAVGERGAIRAHVARPLVRRGPMRRGATASVVALVLLALGVRLALVPFHRFMPNRVCTSDSAAYLELARSLSDRGVFGRGAQMAGYSPENPGDLETFRTPGYPFLLAMLMRLPAPAIPLVLGLQILLDAVAVVLVFLMGRGVLPLRWAFAAGLVQVIDVARVVYSNMVMSDVAFTFLLSVAAWLVVSADPEHPNGRAALAGIALTAATAVRPVGVLVFLPLGVFLTVRKAGGKAITILTVAAMVFPAGWTVRNGLRVGQWTLSSAFDLNLCLVAAAKVQARAEGISRAEAERMLGEAAVASSPGPDPAARSAAFRAVGWRTLRRYPNAAAHELLLSAMEITLAGERRNLLRLLGHPGGSDELPAFGEGARDPRAILGELLRGQPSGAALVALQLVWNAVLLMAAAVGVVALACRRKYAELGLLMLMLVVVLGPSLVVANGRLRMPVSFVVTLLGVYGVRSVFSRRTGSSAGAA